MPGRFSSPWTLNSKQTHSKTEEKTQMSRNYSANQPPPRTAVELSDERPKRRCILPVWFFIGLNLLICPPVEIAVRRAGDGYKRRVAML